MILLFSGSILTSCKKPTGPSIAVITVLDSLNKPVAGATVELTSKLTKPPGTVYDKQETGSDGKTRHSFELEAILDVIVTKGNKTGSDIVKLEPHDRVERTVILN